MKRNDDDPTPPPGLRGVRPCFIWVKPKIRIHSSATPGRLEKLKRNVKYRCSVMTLFREADVDIEANRELAPD